MTNEANTGRVWAAATAPLMGLLIGYLAALIQSTFAPVGVFPLLVGVAAGSTVAGFFYLAGGSGRVLPIVSTMVTVTVCLATLHYTSFLLAKAEADRQAESHQKAHQQIMQAATGLGDAVPNMPAPPRITTFREHLNRQWDVGRPLGPMSVSKGPLLLWWILDGVLMLVGGAVATSLLLAPRKPHAMPKEMNDARRESSV